VVLTARPQGASRTGRPRSGEELPSGHRTGWGRSKAARAAAAGKGGEATASVRSGLYLPRRKLLLLAGGVALAGGGVLWAACGSGGAGAGPTAGGAGSAQGAAGSGTASAGGLKVLGGNGASLVKIKGNTVTMSNQGADFWGSSDAGTFFATKVSGDGVWIVRVVSLDTSTSDWAKAGIMARNSPDPTSADVFGMISAQHGFGLQHRDTDGDNEGSNPDWDQSDQGAQPSNIWIKLERKGDTWTTWDSADGKNWQNPATPTVTPKINKDFYIGLASTSHNGSQAGTAVFDNWQGPPLGMAFQLGA
jgi:regulation of enolase protein 1 (concanavalin A-like superfamily)